MSFLRPSKKRAEAALAPLAPVIEGTVSDGRLCGTYGGYEVEVSLRKTNPNPSMQSWQGGSTTAPGPRVHIMCLTLRGVSGGHAWDCRSKPTLASEIFPTFRVFFGLIRTEFTFDPVTAQEAIGPLAGQWLAKKLGVPVVDEQAQQRLRAAGLFDDLSSLRWGRHPYLPKADFNPGGQANGTAELASMMKERLRTAGHPEFETAIDQNVEAAKHDHPGQLSLQVEVGKAMTVDEQQFRELLDRAVHIAQINAEADPA